MKIDRIIERMDKDNLNTLILLKPENIAYLTGFYPSSIAILILKDDPVLFCSKMDMEEAQQKSSISVEEFKSLDELRKIIKATIQGRVGVEYSLTMGTYRKLCGEMQVELTHIIEDFRAIKSTDEIKKIKKSIKIAEDSFKNLDFSGNEDNLAAQLEYNMRSAGSNKPSFETIVASGSRSSLPHASTTLESLESPLMIDWGAMYQNYASDITRTLIRDEEKEREIFSIVLEAQQKAIDAIKPDVKASYIDEVARGVIEDYGYGDNFIHSTGHGVGLEIHEKPSLSFKSDEILEKGMVVTVEPGIYLEGKFGIRVEDMVLVKSQAQVLTHLPREILL